MCTTCYLNATLQCLHACDEFKEEIGGTGKDKLEAENGLVFWQQLKVTPKPLKVFEEVRSIEGYQNWTIKEQHDSCELLNRVIDHLEEKENFELRRLFAVGTRTIRTCRVCKEFSQKWVDYHILSLPITNFGTTIEDVIQSFCIESILDDGNKFKCTKCKKPTKATKQMLISKAPKILVLQMKRFKGEDDRRKLKTHVEFDKELVIS